LAGEHPMIVITLSRELGSHGDEIAVRVAQELGLRLIDAETINRAAQQAGVPRTALAELEQEGERGLANQVLKALRTMPGLRSAAPFSTPPASEEDTAAPGFSTVTFPFVGLFSPTVPPLSASLEGYVRMVGLVIRGLAHEGNVLLLGRGGQVLLKDHPGTLHIQTVAPLAHRVEVLMTRHALNKRGAQSRVRASDRARFDYLRRYHNVDWLDPTLYHLVINTARVPIATAVNLIIDAQHAIEQAADTGDADAQ
jgi:cytidylate kinase